GGWGGVVTGGRVAAGRGGGRGGAVARLRSGGGLLCGRKAAGVRAGGRSCGGVLIAGCGWLRPRIRLRAGCGGLRPRRRLRARRWLGRVWAGRGLMGVVLLRGPDTVLVCFGFGLCSLLLGTPLGLVFGLLLFLGLLLGAFLLGLALGLVALLLAFFGKVGPPLLDAAEQLVEATTLLVVGFLGAAGEGRVVGVEHGGATGCGAACGRVGVEDRGAGGLTDLVVGCGAACGRVGVE